ncbi:ArsR/SmtB family transcription factor [Desulfothermus sp.]
MKKFIKVMKALSDPNRVKVLKMLQTRTLCVCEIQAALKVAQSTVSKHLKILEEADLVIFEKDGLWVNYMINLETDNPYAKKMLELLDEWLSDDPQIISLLEELKDISREKIVK